jgi:hypothetical protein
VDNESFHSLLVLIYRVSFLIYRFLFCFAYNLSFYLFSLLTILFCFSQDPTIPVYISVREFQSMLHRNDLSDVWRKLNSETKRYTFKHSKSKSRIDYILCSNALSSKVFG